jgi:predicted Fe-Mo cluster-binding NifX family protein
MIIAIPVNEGKISPHFGQSENYLLFDVDTFKKEIRECAIHRGPPREPGLLPTWLAKLGTDVVIANGMGSNARKIFEKYNIGVVDGAPIKPAEKLVQEYLSGKLHTGDNICDH